MANDSMYKKIYDDLLSDIKSGAYDDGARMPSEKELAEQYGVSRITSKKALEMLAERQYVFRQPGRGTFVSTGAKRINEDAEAIIEMPKGASSDSAVKSKPKIGIIMDSMGVSFGLDIMNGLEYECQRTGYLPIIRFTYGTLENERMAIRDMLDAGVSGIALMCVQGRAYNEDILKLYLDHFPVVLLDRGMPGISLPVVCTDNYRAAYDLTRLFLDAGHTKFGIISHSEKDTQSVQARLSGINDALDERDIAIDPNCIIKNMDAYMKKDTDGQDDIEYYKREISDYIDAHPNVTAIFAIEFQIAKLFYTVLLEKGLIGKIQVGYFDGFPDLPAPISQMPHVIQDQFRIGVQAVRDLERRMRGEEVPEYDFIPHTIIGSAESI